MNELQTLRLQCVEMLRPYFGNTEKMMEEAQKLSFFILTGELPEKPDPEVKPVPHLVIEADKDAA